MERRIHPPCSSGYSLLELLLVLAVLGLCLIIASVSLVRGLRMQEARGAAQTWQAGAAWAQVGVLWQGGATELEYRSGAVALRHSFQLCGGDLGGSAPPAPVATNVAQWRSGEGAVLRFSGNLASPNGGGSLYFGAPEGLYRVVVRPETGLTVRRPCRVGP